MPKASKPVLDIAHYGNGAIRSRGFTLDGEMHGKWEFFRKDGSVMRAGEFDRGRQVGTWRTFDRAGRMVKETDFSGGGRTPMPGTGDRGPMQRSIRSRLDPDGVHDRLGLG